MSIKALIHQAAATLSAGVVSNLPDDLPLDPEVKEDKLRLANLLAWELHRVYYHAIVGAIDSVQWPTPKTFQGPDLDPSKLLGLIQEPAIRALLGPVIEKIPELISGGVKQITDESKPKVPSPAV